MLLRVIAIISRHCTIQIKIENAAKPNYDVFEAEFLCFTEEEIVAVVL